MSSDPFDLAASPPTPSGRDEPAAIPPYLDKLNVEQRAAVEALDGPVLVLAGAGTGKTRVLVTRLAHILTSGRAFPSQILAVTFTNKAAREMMERVSGLIGNRAEGLWLGTFHAIGAKILRRHAELVGLKPNFTILDADDQVRLIKQLLEAAGIDDKKWPARALSAVIQRWKDRGLTPDKIGHSDEGTEAAGGRLRELYGQYQERLKTLNACDFGDLMLHCVTLFTQNAEILADYQRRFRYLLVDEYQDTNVVQYLWLRLLAQGSRNICCVGDDDQSIYGWRGAEVGNILRFEKDFPGATVIRLERNYRSTGHILGAASGLIAHNEGRLGKTLWTEDAEGHKVVVGGVWDGEQEAREIAEEIEAQQRAGTGLDNMAILVRTGSQMREFEDCFFKLGIPYRVIGGPRFYERQEIRDAIAYLRLVAQPDDDLAFERIVNTPRRGLGDASLQVLHRIARAENRSLMYAAGIVIGTDEVGAKARSSLRDLLESFNRWRAAANGLPPAELTELVLDESGYVGMWQNDKSAEGPGRVENLKELVAGLEEFESLAAFLEHVSLVMDRDATDSGEKLTLMSLHAAKGLEFDLVFLPGWEEGLFPHQRALDESGTAGLEEERRLAYVGITRARKRAYISFAANRRLFNQWSSNIPSRFVEELPADHVDVKPNAIFNQQPQTQRGWSDVSDDNSRWATSSKDSWNNGGRPSGGMAGRAFDARKVGPNSYAAAPEKTAANGLKVGDRVFHQKFGYGRIAAIDANKLEINFDKAGLKKVLDNFVDPA
jgi:DNA helicase-2/ATP-dependent DNA helicase PcrA